MTKMVALLMLVVFGMALVCFVADLVTPQTLSVNQIPTGFPPSPALNGKKSNHFWPEHFCPRWIGVIR